jgi:hypothetical protein
MARDLIHGTYVPKPDVVDVEKLLRGSLRRVKPPPVCFAFDLSPQPLPQVKVDSQLLDCFYRNAISNACKYGAHDGDVVTRVAKSSLGLKVQVVNKPGQGHAELAALSHDEAFSLVFCTQDTSQNGTSELSLGEGGWRMHKCARSLGGEVDIAFQEDCTTLTLTCPVGHVDDPDLLSLSSRYAGWKLPNGVWGFAIDDSGMQRKLLGKFLQHCGLPDDRIIIRGGTVSVAPSVFIVHRVICIRFFFHISFCTW